MNSADCELPTDKLALAINSSFGSIDQFRAELTAAAVGQFGSGWAWLAADGDGRLSVRKTPNQDSPLPLVPLLGCDVWEHAYYLPYQNRRDEYFDAWWRLVDWPAVSRRYEEAAGSRALYPTP